MIENYAVEQGPSREANSSSAYQQIPSILWNPSVLCSHELTTCPYPEPEKSNARHPILFLKCQF
jgi:hypothetical protein